MIIKIIAQVDDRPAQSWLVEPPAEWGRMSDFVRGEWAAETVLDRLAREGVRGIDREFARIALDYLEIREG
jgi:hypothetical protein